MERTHSELSTRFTNGLSSNSTNSFANFNSSTCSQITAITFTANADFGFAIEYGTDFYFFTQRRNLIRHIFSNIIIDMVTDITIIIQNIFSKITSYDTVAQRFNNSLFIFTFGNRFNLNTFDCIIANFNIADSTISQNSVDNCFVISRTGFDQHCTISCHNIFSNFSAIKMMHHCFFQYSIRLFIADINLNCLGFFSAHL